MIRRDDWRARLAAYIAACWHRPFAYGSHDCALFAAGAVQAMTGVDPAARFRGRYATAEEGAALLLMEGGGLSAIDQVRRLFKPVPVALAETGDLVAIDARDGRALGVAHGARVHFPGPEGLVSDELTRARAAWRV